MSNHAVCWRVAAWVTLGCCTAPLAHAQLFKDTEARRWIAELGTQVGAHQTRQQEQEVTLQAQQEQFKTQLEQLQQALVQMNGELNKMREEVAHARARRVEFAVVLATEAKRQREQDAAMLPRLAQSEPQKVSLDGREFVAAANERRAFDSAIALMKSNAYDQAAAALASFVSRYPGSGYEQPAAFWLGNAQFATRNYTVALATLRGFVQAVPDHPRTPQAWLAISNCHVELKNMAAARKALEDLIKAHPDTEAAATARERLVLLRP